MTIKELRSVTELSPRKLEPNCSRFVQMGKSRPKLGKVLGKDFHLLEETQGREKVKIKIFYDTLIEHLWTIYLRYLQFTKLKV